MKNLQIIRMNEGRQEVSARELYNFLEPKDHFRNWIERMLKYGFIEGVDFRTNLCESNGGRPKKDYILSLDCAKSIAMVQRSEKGRMIRAYFIDCERQLKSQTTEQIEVLKTEIGIYRRMEQIRSARRLFNAEMRVLKENLKQLISKPVEYKQLTLNF